MGEKSFVTGAALNAATVTVGGFDFTEARLNKSTSGFSDSDTAIPTEKTSKARIDTISAVSDGFSMIQWGKVQTTNSVDYIPINPFCSAITTTSTSSMPANNVESYIHFFPFCLNQDMTLKGFEFKSAYDDTGPLWVVIWEDTSYSGSIPYNHGPGDLKAYLKTNPASPSGSYTTQTYVDDGNDGIVYDSSHSNTQVSLSAGIYWISLHGEVNHVGFSNNSFLYWHTNNVQKFIYGGGGSGVHLGYRDVSMKGNFAGLRISSGGTGHAPDSSDGSWTPPSSWTAASSFSHSNVDYALYGPPLMALYML